MKGHELFPGTEENPSPDVHSILVTRSEGGAMMQVPYGYVDQAELPNVAAVFAKYGGGVYELIARDQKKIVSRVRINIAGESKPLDGRTPPIQAQPVVVPSGGSGNMASTIIAALSALAPVFLGWMQMQGQQAQAQMQMMMGMLNAKSADASQQTQTMAQMYSAQTAQMAQLFTAMAKGGGGDSSEGVVKGMEMMQELMTSMGGGGEGDGETVNPIQMMEKLMTMFREAKELASVTPPLTVPGSTVPAPAPEADEDEEPEAEQAQA